MINLMRAGYGRLGVCLLSLLLVSGCISRMAQEPEDRAGAEAVMRNFITDMVEGDADGMIASASMPFWIDRWFLTAAELREEMPDDAAVDLPGLSEVVVRVYPIGDLAVLRPEVWNALKDSNSAYLENLYVAAVALRFKEGEPEAGLALLRRVNGAWRLAGLIED